MKKVMFLCAALTLFSSQGLAGDVTVTISEKTVNEFIAAIGPIKGSGKKRGIKYTWKVKKAEIDFEPGSAQFIALVDLKAGPFKTSNTVKSKVIVTYDSESNKIKMKVEKAIYKIYIKILGKKIKVGEVDIAKYYKPKFEFNGPEPVQSVVEVATGKNKVRIIKVTTTNSQLTIEKDRIRTSVDLVYSGSDKP
ncbi:MAG: hypothetical protein IIB95_00425 [Candidatus Marinimicrobia bacterium]|nr:hypothetical protein [Candidatus Neomarinimicrobiota bacterium]MCH7762188.1 hypothetical protein [Candidatus Neomarinimicrobiota bacterium]